MTARDRTVLIVVGVIVAIAAAWLLLVAPVRNHASELGSQISTAQSQLATAREQIAAGQAARQTFATSYTTMARLGEAVPADDDVASLIVQVQAAASASRIDFQSLSLAPGGGGSSTTPTSSAVAGAPTVTPPPGATVGPAGFPVEPFTFAFDGSFFHLSDFFGRLERFVRATNTRIAVSGRLMTLNAISLGPGPHGFPQITATVSATTYILPAAQGLQAGASPAGPAGTSAASSSSAGASTPVAAIGVGR